jgi:hypothetical protein
MSYATISRCAQDGDLQQRLIACAAQEGHPEPQSFILGQMWTIASNPSIADPYAYAVGQRIDRPGKYDDVISDSVILGVVQPLVQAALQPE